jgi:hypothetical protein
MPQTYAARRADNRMAIRTTALLVGRHWKLGVEKKITVRVCTEGVRVISTSEWDRDDTILAALPEGHFISVARMRYCDHAGDGRFGTGLNLCGRTSNLRSPR